MPCKSKLKAFAIHPFGLVLICVGCAIVALVQNKALAEGAEKQKNEEGNKEDKAQGPGKVKAQDAEPEAGEEEAPAEEDA
ncbi:hypothetical protein HUJ05_006955 [Dendroctonus ponderosae]|nr:hypothetical protein HUJ05_006955 [Dendroctonus ponderosae]